MTSAFFSPVAIFRLLSLSEASYFSKAVPSPLSLSSSSSSSPSRRHPPHYRRVRGDTNGFSSFNELLSRIDIELPDANVTVSGIDFYLTDIVCRDLAVMDVTLDLTSLPSNSTMTRRLSAHVEGVDVSCGFRWDYLFDSLVDISGGGTGDAKTNSVTSSISVQIDFVSDNYATSWPTDAILSSCESLLHIEDPNFEGDGGLDIVENIIDVAMMVGAFRDSIEGKLNNRVCKGMTGMLVGALDKLINATSDRINDLFLLESNDDASLANVDPLSTERAANVPVDEGGYPLWIDFVESENFVRRVTGMESLELLAQNFMGGDDGGGVSGAIASFIRRNGILDEDGLLVIDPSMISGNNSSSSSSFLEFEDMFTRTKMFVTNASVGGLDSLNSNGTKVLDPIGKYTLRNTFTFESLSFAFDVEAEIRPASGDSPVIRETFTIEVAMQEVFVDLYIFIGVNNINGTLGDMPLGSIVDVEHLLSCLLTIVDDANITELVVNATEVRVPILYGLDDASGGTGYLIKAMADALFAMYGQVLSYALPSFLGSSVKDVATEYLNDRINDDACPDPDASLTGLVDYRDLFLSEEDSISYLGRGGTPYGVLVRYMYDYINRILSTGEEDGLSALNELIAMLPGVATNDEGNIVLVGDLIKRNLDTTLNGLLHLAVEIAVSNVTLSDLDSFDVIKLLAPVMGEASVLDSESSVEDPFRLSFTLLVKGKVDELEFENMIELGLTLVHLDIALRVLAQMKEVSLMNFPLKDLTNLNCWMSTIVTPVLDEFGIRVGEHDSGLVLRDLAILVEEARLDMKCIRCTGTALMEMERLTQTEEGIADATELMNKVFEYGSNLLQGDYVQNQIIDMILNNATYHCPHSPLFQQNFPGLVHQSMPVVSTDAQSFGFLFAAIGVIAIVAVSATIISVVGRCLTRRRHNRWMRTLKHEQVIELARLERDDKSSERDLNLHMKSLFMCKEVPLFIRYFIPIIIMGNCALFLSGHLSLGGTVNISGNIGEHEFDVVGFYEFSMANSSK